MYLAYKPNQSLLDIGIESSGSASKEGQMSKS